MFVSRVRLRGGRGGAGALAAFLSRSAESAGQAHHLIWSLFGDRGGARHFLYRMDGPSASRPVTVLSPEPPRDPFGLWEVETKRFALLENLRDGDAVEWLLRVNATRKHEVVEGGKARTKRRCLVSNARRAGDARDDLAIAAEAVPAWLAPRLLAGGLGPTTPVEAQGPEADAAALARDMAVTAFTRARFGRGPGERDEVTVSATDLRGRAVVRSADALRAALPVGFGAARAYGCGLMLLRRGPGRAPMTSA